MKFITHALRHLVDPNTYRPFIRRYTPEKDELIAEWDETLHKARQSAEYTQRTGLPFEDDLFPAHAKKQEVP